MQTDEVVPEEIPWSQFDMRHKTRTVSIFENQLICSVGIRVDRCLAYGCQNRFHVPPGSAALLSCQWTVKIEGVRERKDSHAALSRHLSADMKHN